MKHVFFRHAAAAAAALSMLLSMNGCGPAMTAIEMLQSSSEPSSDTVGSSLSDMLPSLPGSAQSSSTASSTLSDLISQAQSVPPSPSEPEEYVDETGSLVWVHQMLLDTESICGIAFVGYTGDSMDGGYREYIEGTAYGERYPFMAEIPEEHIVDAGGDELYCITPFNAAHIAIDEWIIPEGTGQQGYPGEVLYHGSGDQPILIRCNESDLHTNVQINIVDENGNVLIYYPSLNLMDGTVLPAENVYDFSIYPYRPDDEDRLMPIASLEGEWRTDEVVDDNGDPLEVSLSFRLDRQDGSCEMTYWYGYPDSDRLESFEGYCWRVNEDYDYHNEESFIFGMSLTGGLAVENGIEPYYFEGEFLIVPSDEYDDTIIVWHMGGLPLISGLENTELTFYKYES